jgi:hypothetical protein
MQNKLEFLKAIYNLVKKPSQESLKFSMSDTHYPGLFSLVIGGNEFGNFIRVFIADTEMNPYAVQLHSHRYPIRLTTIKGKIQHFVAFRSEIIDCHTVSLSEFEYKSPLNGGNGLKYLQESNVILKDYLLPIGSTLQMTENEIHTVACSKGSIWIVEEQGFKNDCSRVLGVPFVTDSLYNQPTSLQINDKCQIVAKEIKKLILDYELV